MSCCSFFSVRQIIFPKVNSGFYLPLSMTELNCCLLEDHCPSIHKPWKANKTLNKVRLNLSNYKSLSKTIFFSYMKTIQVEKSFDSAEL